MSQGKNRPSRRLMLFTMLATMFMGNGADEKTANKRAFHQAFLGGGNGEYLTNKHPKMSYAQQNRIAKKNRKMKARSPK